MEGRIAGFDWDRGNRKKCQKHGVSVGEIEGLFVQPVMILPDTAHSLSETRFRAIGKTQYGRHRLSSLHDQGEGGKEVHPADQRPPHAQDGDRTP